MLSQCCSGHWRRSLRYRKTFKRPVHGAATKTQLHAIIPHTKVSEELKLNMDLPREEVLKQLETNVHKIKTKIKRHRSYVETTDESALKIVGFKSTRNNRFKVSRFVTKYHIYHIVKIRRYRAPRSGIRNLPIRRSRTRRRYKARESSFALRESNEKLNKSLGNGDSLSPVPQVVESYSGRKKKKETKKKGSEEPNPGESTSDHFGDMLDSWYTKETAVETATEPLATWSQSIPLDPEDLNSKLPNSEPNP